MADAATEFFAELAKRGHEPLLGKVTGTLRIELVEGDETERWLIAVDRGDVTVSRKNTRADCRLRTSKASFEGMARGEVNATAAYLRGDMVAEGNWEVLVLFQSLFPGPPASQARSGS